MHEAVIIAAELSDSDAGTSSEPYALAFFLFASLTGAWGMMAYFAVVFVRRRLGGFYGRVETNEMEASAVKGAPARAV